MKRIAIALLAACGTESAEHTTIAKDEGAQSLAVTSAAESYGRGVALERAARARSTVANAPVAPSTEALPGPARQTVVSGMIIRNGYVTILVDSIEPAIERVRAMTTALGGVVGGLSIEAGERQVRRATLQLKIPAARFDSAMTGMPGVGKVEQSNTSAEDVGEEFVDVSARVSNAKRLEERLVTLLATRTGKLEDVLAVERELARVREEIERYEGRIRFLSTRVATSTITATVHEKPPIIAAAPGDNVIARAFINAWRNFVRLVTMGIELLGVLVPAMLVVFLGFLGWRRWRPRV